MTDPGTVRFMKRTVLITLAYALLGMAGLTLAIPPGYASPVFPAAGLALSGALWFGRGALPGIWLGSAILNLAHNQLYGTLTPISALVALVIATAAVLQAVGGRWLVNRWLGPAWQTLEREQEIFGFLLLGGVLACVLSSSISVGAIAAGGLIEPAEVPFTWWNWYLGDTLGVLVFAPLTLAILDRSTPLWRERRRRLLIPMLATLGLATLAFYGTARWEKQEQDTQRRTDGETMANHIADRLITHREVLSSLRHFIEATPDFSFAQFEQFTRLTLRDNPDIFALSFNDLVTDAERPAFERRISGRSPLGPYQITERDDQRRLIRAATRPEYVAVRYIVPLVTNQPAVGYDIYSESIRRAAIERALTTHAMAVTAPIRLVQEQQPRVGVLELLPVEGEPRTDTSGASRPLGFAVAVVKVDEMVDIATRGQVPAGLVFQLTDPRAPAGQTLLYRSDAPAVGATPMVQAPVWTSGLRMGDREWDLSVYTTESYRQQHRPWLAWAVGVAGLLFTTLLQVLMLGMTGRTALIQRQNDALKASEERTQRYRDHLEDVVAERTRQLVDTNRFLRMVTDNLPGMVAYWDRDERCQFANAPYLEWLGRPSDGLIGMPLRELLGESLYAQNTPYLQAALRGEAQQFERTLHKADGSTGYTIANYIPDIQDGVVRGIVVLVTDITAIKTAQFALERLNRKLAENSHLAESANRAKGEFLANMSHEIRTPMNAIIGMAHLAIKTDPTPLQRDYLRKIQGASQHLLGILNDILDFSKIEAGKLIVEHIDFDLEKVLDQVASLVDERAAAKGLEVIIAIDDAVPMQLVGDPLRIGQVLVNFANNSVKFTEAGEIAMHVGLISQGDDGVVLHFSVRDTGIGLDEEQRQHLFESFQQGDTSITRKYGGTGLGLAISKRLAELMGGEIGVDSTPGQGSTFWFTAHVGRSRAPARRLHPDPDWSGRRLLVVDDNANTREVIGNLLRRMSFMVTAVDSGPAALTELAQAAVAGEPYALVLLDWKMPVMDGIETAREIRRLALQPQGPLLLMVTAYHRDEVNHAAAQVGIEDILIKPVSPSLLFDALIRAFSIEPSEPPLMDGPSGEPRLDTAAIAGARVLLVEDNELNQEVATAFLNEAGLVVDLATDGAVALDKVKSNAYDLVLMDMQMPVMDGITATRAIRQLSGLQDLPIVAMTANAMAGDRERCLDAGMNDHMAKPIDPQDLLTKLRRWVKPQDRDIHAMGSIGTDNTTLDQPALGAVDLLTGISGLDVARGLRQAMGREALYHTLLQQFVAGQAAVPAQLAEALRTTDWTGAERMAHTLKGVAAQIGAGDLCSLADQLEQGIRNRVPSAQLNTLQGEIERVLTTLIAAITSRLPQQTPHRQAATPVDPAQLRDTCTRLAALMRADDFACVQLFNEHARLLQTALGDRFTRIAEALDNYDFSVALDELKQALVPQEIAL
jgi:PAS domain S-box-containing protein